MSKTFAEQETVFRWDREEKLVHAWTANSFEAAKWRRKGWPVREEAGSWWVEMPVRALQVRGRAAVEAKRPNGGVAAGSTGGSGGPTPETEGEV